jgi:hypothetical protein
MKYLFTTILAITATSLMANGLALGAHEHGSIKLEMAVEKNIIELNIDGPTESFMSFEYLPKSAKEKKIFEELKTLWEKKLFTLITFDSKLNCKIAEATLKQVIDEKETKEEQAKIKDPKKKEQGVHSDIEAKAKISCKNNLAGSNVEVSLKKYFKNIKKLTAEIVSTETKSVEITKDSQMIKL